MNSKFSALLLMLLVWSPTLAQTTKRRGAVRKSVVAAPQPEPVSPPPSTPRPAQQPISLVIVNDQTFTSANLEPALRNEFERLDDKIAEARNAVLDQEINTILLQAEAKKRRIDTRHLYELEVTRRVPAITPADIKKFIDDNRQQIEGLDPAIANQQVEGFLRQQAEQKLADDLVKRLRKTIPVIMGVDIHSASLNANAVVATIAGEPLKAASLIERLKPIVYRIRLEAYELAKKQTDQLVNDLLLRAEISDKPHWPRTRNFRPILAQADVCGRLPGRLAAGRIPSDAGDLSGSPMRDRCAPASMGQPAAYRRRERSQQLHVQSAARASGREAKSYLSETIAANLEAFHASSRPAGTGLGAATVSILDTMGFIVDTSVSPRFDFSRQEGPDFRQFDSRPFFLTKTLLEVPCTIDYVGWTGRWRAPLYRLADTPLWQRLHALGVLARRCGQPNHAFSGRQHVRRDERAHRSAVRGGTTNIRALVS